MAASPPPPPPRGAPSPAAARYAYLVTRLRNRQITMEEATELFGILDETVRALRLAASRPMTVAPTPPPAPGESSSPPRTPPSVAGSIGSIAADDLLTVGVLMIGAGAGISAALRDRARNGPRPQSPKPESKP